MLNYHINNFKYVTCCLILFMGTFVNAQEIQTKKQLIGHYTLDGEVKDLSGNDHHGDLYGVKLESDRMGNTDGAVSLNQKSFIKVASDFPEIKNEVSIALWVLTQDDSIQTVASKYFVKDGLGNGFRLLIEDGKAIFGGRDGSSDYRSSGPSTTLVNDSIWHFIVGVCRDGNWEIWVDGKKENEEKSDYKYTDLSNDYSLLIGNSPQLQENLFTGLLDDLRIYAHALREIDILMLYKGLDMTAKDEIEMRVANNMATWEKRGVYEKTDDYLERVNPSTRLIKREELTEQTIQELGQSHFQWQHQYVNHHYDADAEKLSLHFEGFEPYIVDMSIEVAKHYDLDNFHLLSFENTQFGLTEKGNLKIVKLDIVKAGQKKRKRLRIKL